MNPDPRQVKVLFAEAVEKHQPDQWPALLDQACAGPPELRGRVELLLAAHRETGTVQHEARAEDSVPSPVSGSVEQPGTVIGSYRLLELIGEGGFGIVYLAEQMQPV